MAGRLPVRVNDELTLDAGTWEDVAGPDGPERLVRPPAVPLFRQVLDYLRAKPDPSPPPAGSFLGREGLAAAALCLRWGSYLAVLLDHDKPLWAAVRSPTTSRIADAEMARIHIEASAALAEWIDLYRAEPGGAAYRGLVERAVAYLPLPRRTAKRAVCGLMALAHPAQARQLVEASGPEVVERRRPDAERHPTRLLANAIVNTAWRNGPVEDIHAGTGRGYPLDRRRATPTEERTLLRFASERLATAMAGCELLAHEAPGRSWPEQVLPFGLAHTMQISPTGWSLTETSREVRLPR